MRKEFALSHWYSLPFDNSEAAVRTKCFLLTFWSFSNGFYLSSPPLLPSFLSIVSNYPLVIANQITVGALCLLTERVLLVHRHIHLTFCAPVFTVLLHVVIFTGTPVPSFLRCARKIAERGYLFRHVCLSFRPSVCPHGTTRLPLGGF